jgi:hypothetical protein
MSPTRVRSSWELEDLAVYIKVVLIPPPPRCWIFPVFHEREPRLFFALGRASLLLSTFEGCFGSGFLR